MLNNIVPEADYTKLMDKIVNLNTLYDDDNSLQMLVDLHKNSCQNVIQNHMQDLLEMPQYDESLNYREIYWKIYTQNITQLSQLKELILEQYLTNSEIQTLQNMLKKMDYYNSDLKIKNRNRRMKNQIDLMFGCGYEGCRKKYGTEIALNNHIRYKHHGGTKRDRRRYLNMIINAWIANKESIFPVTRCVFPKTFFKNVKDFLSKHDDFRDEIYTNDLLRKLWNQYLKQTTLVEKQSSKKIRALNDNEMFVSKNTKSRMKIDKRFIRETHIYKYKKERLQAIKSAFDNDKSNEKS